MSYIFGSNTSKISNIEQVVDQVAELKERINNLESIAAVPSVPSVPKFEQIVSSIADGSCSTDDIDQFTIHVQPKHNTLYEQLYEQLYELLTTCIKTNNTTILEKLLNQYFEILTYAISDKTLYPDIAYDIACINHTKCFCLAVEHGNIKAAIMLLRNKYSNLQIHMPHYTYCTNIVYGNSSVLSDDYGYITLDNQTLHKYKNNTHLYTNLQKVYRKGEIKRVCICKTNIHEYCCMYNEINCIECHKHLANNWDANQNLHNQHIPESIENQLIILANATSYYQYLNNYNDKIVTEELIDFTNSRLNAKVEE